MRKKTRERPQVTSVIRGPPPSPKPGESRNARGAGCGGCGGLFVDILPQHLPSLRRGAGVGGCGGGVGGCGGFGGCGIVIVIHAVAVCLVVAVEWIVL